MSLVSVAFRPAGAWPVPLVRPLIWVPLAAALIGLAVFAGRPRLSPAPTAKAPAKAEAPLAPAWREIASPEHIYDLDASAFRAAPVDYTARQGEDGAREDTLTRGAFDGTTPALRLRLSRRTGASPPPTPLFAALAHEAAAAGLSVGRSGLAEIMPTRFGRFEIADLSLARPDGEALPCSGFRLVLDAPALSISGLACGGRSAPLSRREIGCLVERLDVAAVGNDRALAAFFAETARARDPVCMVAEAAASDVPPVAAGPAATGKLVTGRRRLRRH